MEDITIITEKLRNQVIDNYNEYRNEFFSDKKDNYEYYEDDDIDEEIDEDDEYYEDDDIDEEIDEDDEFFDSSIDDFIEYESDQYEKQVFLKLSDGIKESKYKKIIYLIFLEDVYEYIKTKQINQEKLYDYEEILLHCLEKENLNILMKKLDNSDEFMLDIITLFIEYNFDQKAEDKYKNRKIIESSNYLEYLKKFKIYLLDDMQYEYKKRRKN